MAQNFDWNISAHRHVEVYRHALHRKKKLIA
jgi:hypothetical protein